MNSHEKGFDKIESESVVNKKGETSNWRDLDEHGREYWSEAAMRPRSPEEQYPKQSAETPEAYSERLRVIGKYAMKDASTEEYRPNRYYPYGEIKGTTVRGFKFEKHSPRNTAESYSSIFAERQIAQGIEDSIADETRVREEGKLLITVDTPRVFEKQKDLARYYIGPLDFREHTKYHGVFEGAGESRYSSGDSAWVDKEKSVFLRNDQNNKEKIEGRIAGRMLEGFFYPLVRHGFFDSPDRPASAIISSDYDDFKNKADFSVVVPLDITSADGRHITGHQPISFDLTTGFGKNKTARIKETFDERQGLTQLDYPSTCLKREIAPMKDVPHFVLCLPPTECNALMEKLASGKLPSSDIQDLINYQIYAQSVHWAEHYARISNPSATKARKKFEMVAAHFLGRLDLSTKGGAKYLAKIHQQHREATHYIAELKQPSKI